MGRPKLLLPWGESTVLHATLAALQGGGVERIVLVTAPGHGLEELAPPPGVELAENPEPASGMLSSVQIGWQTLVEGPTETILICPADLPALRPATVRAMLAAHREHGGPVLPSYHGERGHPLLLPRRWAARIPELDPAIGLRQLLALAASELLRLPVDDPGTVRDVDTPEAYERLRPRSGGDR
jgi:molybdenum cofactor cytidylyltransferase